MPDLFRLASARAVVRDAVTLTYDHSKDAEEIGRRNLDVARAGGSLTVTAAMDLMLAGVKEATTAGPGTMTAIIDWLGQQAGVIFGEGDARQGVVRELGHVIESRATGTMNAAAVQTEREVLWANHRAVTTAMGVFMLSRLYHQIDHLRGTASGTAWAAAAAKDERMMDDLVSKGLTKGP